MSSFDFEEYIKRRDTDQQGAVAWGRQLQATNAAQATELAAAIERAAQLQAELNELRANTLVTRFGACPMKPGGSGLEAAQSVVTKWGKGAAVRQFFGSGVAPRPVDASLCHASFKPTLAAITDDNVRAWFSNYREGDAVEVWHEADKKVSDGAYSYPDLLARKNKFYDTVKRVRPDLLVVNTLTGWLLDPKSGKDPTRWGEVKADVLGVDCDGVRPSSLPYTNYEAETKSALEFIERFKANGYTLFAIPEFGCPRIVTADPDGIERAKYHEAYFQLWTQTKLCAWVTMYEYDSSPNYSLSTPAEVAGLKKWVTP